MKPELKKMVFFLEKKFVPIILDISKLFSELFTYSNNPLYFNS